VKVWTTGEFLATHGERYAMPHALTNEGFGLFGSRDK
jgi:hypothetical protein